MSDVAGVIIATLFLVAGAFGVWAGSQYLLPVFRTNNYVNWYKVGRIKQFAEESKIDIQKVMVEDMLLRREESRLSHELMGTWTDAIHQKFADELRPINADLQKRIAKDVSVKTEGKKKR